MASGDTLITLSAVHGTAPTSTFATLGVIAGTSSPVETVHVANFDDTIIEYLDFTGLSLPTNYGGGGLTCSIKWAGAAATNAVVWGLAIRRVQDDAEDLDTTAHTYDYNDVTATAPSVIGELAYDTVTFTSGTDMDSLAAGEYFIMRVRRNATSGSDTMAGDARLAEIAIKET